MAKIIATVKKEKTNNCYLEPIVLNSLFYIWFSPYLTLHISLNTDRPYIYIYQRKTEGQKEIERKGKRRKERKYRKRKREKEGKKENIEREQKKRAKKENEKQRKRTRKKRSTKKE